MWKRTKTEGRVFGMQYRTLTLAFIIAVAMVSSAGAATLPVTDWAGVIAATPGSGDTVDFGAG